MTNSFWTGGEKAYAKGLREHYGPLIRDLRERRESSSAVVQDELDIEIRRVEAEYKSKLDSGDDLIF